MTGRQERGAAGYFGRQVRRERVAAGWTIQELAQRASIDAAHLGRIESGKRPPTGRIADALDMAFPSRRGWFRELYDESQTWREISAGFRSWAEHEDRTATIRAWTPGIIDGLAQTRDYARALLAAEPAITEETAENRLEARMERQRRVLTRCRVTMLVDESALIRQIGSAEIMTAQLRRLLEVAGMPPVTVQVVPAIAHAALASGYLIADDAVWCEHVVSGGVYTEPEIVTSVEQRHDSLRAECYRASESVDLIRRMMGFWETGRSPLTGVLAPTAPAVAASASR